MRREDRAVKAIVASGASVYYSYQLKADGSVDHYAPRPQPERLGRLLGWRFLSPAVVVDCDRRFDTFGMRFYHIDPNAPPLDFSAVSQLDQLRTLIFAPNKINDEQLQSIRGLPDLRCLELTGMQICSSNFSHCS